MEKLKLGSLFDGIGGFPFAAMQWEIEPVWASEIEPWPIKVTRRHFPKMKHLGDITQINGAEIEPVDIITFGSPCTRLSVAGRHDGFDITFKCTGEKDNPHEVYSKTIRAINKYQYKYTDKCPFCGQELSETNESALFFHAIRIINEMRDATNDKYPRFAVWENVPGAYSSNNGQDFRAVLEEISQAEIPMPASGKWANAGMVRTERIDIAWRTLDAQYWGVPQRRKRIFLVADFTGQCAGEILFESEGLRGDIAESRKAREETAGAAGGGIKSTDYLTGWDCQEKRIFSDKGVAPTLSGSDGGGGRTGAGFVAQLIRQDSIRGIEEPICCRMREGVNGGDKGPLVSKGKSHTLGCNNDQIIFPVEEIAGALDSHYYKGPGMRAGIERTVVAQCVTTGPGRRYDPETETLIPVMLSGDDKVRTLTARADSSPCVDRGQDVVFVSRSAGFSYKASPSAGSIGFKEEQSPTMLSERQDSAVILYDITHADEVVRSVKKGCSPTLNHRMGTGGNQIPICIQNATRGKSQSGLGISQDGVSYTLDTLGNHAVAFPDPANPLLGKANMSFRGDTDNIVCASYRVRRLTPVECLRLQGFPDWWLDIKGMSDTQKYRAIGNSVAIPCVSFILERIAEVLRRAAA